MVGLTATLLKRQEDPTLTPHVRRLETAARSMNELVESLLERHAEGGHRVYPVHLRVTKPYVTTESKLHDWMLRQGYGHYDVDTALIHHDDENGAEYDKSPAFRKKVNQYALEIADASDPSFAQEMAAKLRDHLISKGHDGIKYKNEVEGGTSWVAFKPEQIKSAIGNRGTYDPNDPDIGKAEGGAAEHPLTQDVYHGTQHEFPAFREGLKVRAEYMPSLMLGTHVARDPAIEIGRAHV